MVRRPNISRQSEEIRWKVLCFLHYQYAQSENSVFSAEEINKQITGVVFGVIQFSLVELLTEGLVSADDDGFLITHNGVRVVDDWDDPTYEEYASGVNFLEADETGYRSANVSDQKLGTSGADIDKWEPLPIERSGTQYELALEASEEALRAIESDNGYSANEPEERDRIVWSIREGIKAAREGLPSRDQIVALLLKPLKFVAEKFSVAAIGEAAKAAAKYVAAWLGS